MRRSPLCLGGHAIASVGHRRPLPRASKHGRRVLLSQMLNMPSLSPTMESGRLVKWHVAAGQEIKPGDILADVETDKATLGFENQDEGFIARILVSEGLPA